MNMALYENGCYFGVKAHSKEHRCQLNGLLAQNIGSVCHGEGMQVDNPMKNIAIMLA
jgi:hypothetical protein